MKKADWTKFREYVDNKITFRYKKKNINRVEKLLRRAILKSANRHIGKKKKRNQLRKQISARIEE